MGAVGGAGGGGGHVNCISSGSGGSRVEQNSAAFWKQSEGKEWRSWRLVPPVQTAVSFSVKSAKMGPDEDY